MTVTIINLRLTLPLGAPAMYLRPHKCIIICHPVCLVQSIKTFEPILHTSGSNFHSQHYSWSIHGIHYIAEGTDFCIDQISIIS